VSAGEHVLDEAFMTGDINNPRRRSVGQIEVSEAEIDRNAALFFLFEPVGILPGQRFNQAGFSVINMSGGADDRA
jgi:hypothetical protein